MQTNKTVTARAWFDTAQSPAAWAVRLTLVEDDQDVEDDILADPDDLGRDASKAEVIAAVEAYVARSSRTLAGVEVL